MACVRCCKTSARTNTSSRSPMRIRSSLGRFDGVFSLAAVRTQTASPSPQPRRFRRRATNKVGCKYETLFDGGSNSESDAARIAGKPAGVRCRNVDADDLSRVCLGGLVVRAHRSVLWQCVVSRLDEKDDRGAFFTQRSLIIGALSSCAPRRLLPERGCGASS